MIQIQGKNGTAEVFIDKVDDTTYAQLISIMNHPATEGSKVRIMPDCHAGKGCVVGSTFSLTDKIVPNWVGVDIGCGMFATKLSRPITESDLIKIDKVIHKFVPHGKEVNRECHEIAGDMSMRLKQIKCPINYDRALYSIGSLGGGNHFIEINKDSNDGYWLVIHSGSRHLGLEIANYYQSKCGNSETSFLHSSSNYYHDYLHDMDIVQQFAAVNRVAMCQTILKRSGIGKIDTFQTVHNYIDMVGKIIRKGAISAKLDQIVVIPMNMQYGSLLCRGKGNSNWNYSAPHGSGRIMSRGQAKKNIKMEDYKKSMENIFSTTVCVATLDEAPSAYKAPEMIVEAIKDTVEVIDILKPIYNFKSS